MAGGQQVGLALGTASPEEAVALTGIASAAATGTLTPSYSGQKATFSTGTVAVSAAPALTGSSVALAAGTMTTSKSGDDAAEITGLEVGVSAGSVGTDIAPELAGEEVVGDTGTVEEDNQMPSLVGEGIGVGQGSLTPAGNDVTVHISGVEAGFASNEVVVGGTDVAGEEISCAAGAMVPSVDPEALVGEGVVCGDGQCAPNQDALDTYISSALESVVVGVEQELTGIEATSAAGDVSITGDAALALIGEECAAEAGDIGIEEDYALTGSELASAQHSLGAPGYAALTGTSSAVEAGSVFLDNDRTYALTGQQIAVQDGATFASPLAFVHGEVLSVGQQGIGPREAVLAGEVLSVLQGRVSPPPSVLVMHAGDGHPAKGQSRDEEPIYIDETGKKRKKSSRELVADILNDIAEDMEEAVGGEPLEEVLAGELDLSPADGKITEESEDDDFLLLTV